MHDKQIVDMVLRMCGDYKYFATSAAADRDAAYAQLRKNAVLRLDITFFTDFKAPKGILSQRFSSSEVFLSFCIRDFIKNQSILLLILLAALLFSYYVSISLVYYVGMYSCIDFPK